MPTPLTASEISMARTSVAMGLFNSTASVTNLSLANSLGVSRSKLGTPWIKNFVHRISPSFEWGGNKPCATSMSNVSSGSLIVFVLNSSDSWAIYSASTVTASLVITGSPALPFVMRAWNTGGSPNFPSWTCVYTAFMTTSVSNLAVTYSYANLGNGSYYNYCLYEITGSETTLGGNSSSRFETSDERTTITTTRENSLIIGSLGDRNAVDGASRAYVSTSIKSETGYVLNGTQWTSYHYIYTASNIGSYVCGFTAPTAMVDGQTVYEIRNGIVGFATGSQTRLSLDLGGLYSPFTY